MGSGGGSEHIKAKEKRKMLWLLLTLSQQMRQKISITLFQFFNTKTDFQRKKLKVGLSFFRNSINAFKKKIFVNFVSFLLTLECGYSKINDM